MRSLDARLKEGKAARMAARPAVAHYRLSRKEYQNTVYDLLGVRYDPTKPGRVERGHALAWVSNASGRELSLSPSHVDRYYRAAELVLDRAFPAELLSEARKIRKTAAELRYGRRGEAAGGVRPFWNQAAAATISIFPAGDSSPRSSPAGLGKPAPSTAGSTNFAFRPAESVRRVANRLTSASARRRARKMWTESSNSISPRPRTALRFMNSRYFLEMPTELVLRRGGDRCHRSTEAAQRFATRSPAGTRISFTHSSETLLLNPNAPQMFDGEGNGIFSTVIVDWIEWEGPLVSEEGEARRRDGVLPPG